VGQLLTITVNIMNLTSIYQIPGFCNFDDIYAHYVDEADDGSVFVELGSLWGRSTAQMAQCIKNSKKNIKFYSVDFWDLRGATAGEWSAGDIHWMNYLNIPMSEDACYHSVLAVLKHFSLDSYVNLIRMSTRVAHNEFEDRSIDFLFIDADHSYEGALEDINLWMPKMKPESVIAGHDYDWPGVKRAVDEVFGDKVYLHNTSWIVSLPL
jgi:predicted O-methyltransferase YrrM